METGQGSKTGRASETVQGLETGRVSEAGRGSETVQGLETGQGEEMWAVPDAIFTCYYKNFHLSFLSDSTSTEVGCETSSFVVIPVTHVDWVVRTGQEASGTRTGSVQN